MFSRFFGSPTQAPLARKKSIRKARLMVEVLYDRITPTVAFLDAPLDTSDLAETVDVTLVDEAPVQDGEVGQVELGEEVVALEEYDPSLFMMFSTGVVDAELGDPVELLDGEIPADDLMFYSMMMRDPVEGEGEVVVDEIPVEELMYYSLPGGPSDAPAGGELESPVCDEMDGEVVVCDIEKNEFDPDLIDPIPANFRGAVEVAKDPQATVSEDMGPISENSVIEVAVDIVEMDLPAMSFGVVEEVAEAPVAAVASLPNAFDLIDSESPATVTTEVVVDNDTSDANEVTSSEPETSVALDARGTIEEGSGPDALLLIDGVNEEATSEA